MKMIQDFKILNKQRLSGKAEVKFLYELSFNLFGEFPDMRIMIKDFGKGFMIEWTDFEQYNDESKKALSKEIWGEFFKAEAAFK